MRIAQRGILDLSINDVSLHLPSDGESMSRLIGYVANRADRMRDALYQERAVLNPKTATDEAPRYGQ